MNVLGIIVEYNPFHNGHLYHLHQSVQLGKADCVVAVMSGNFIQRGEPAIVNKWARAEMALSCGVDLVIELPVVYSMASAEFFAFGAVKILDSLGVVDYICFGSENGRLDELDLAADIFINEPGTYRTALKSGLKTGLSFPAAREKAISKYLNEKGLETGTLKETIRSSNNILGIEYIKAIKRLKSRIKPFAIKRIANTYGCEEITGIISSATSIRKKISSSEIDLDSLLPDLPLPVPVQKILLREFGLGKGPVLSKSFETAILSTVRSMSHEQMKTYPFISEGLENRIKQAALSTGSLEQLIEEVRTRRYPLTRIQRTLLSFLIGLKECEFQKFNTYEGPQYARILGFNTKGRELLSMMKKVSSIPVVVKPANFKHSCNPLLKRMLEIEAAATDIYVLGYDSPEFRYGGQEFTNNPIIID